MSNKQFQNLLTLFGIVVIIGLLITFLKKVNKESKTSIISDEGLDALKNPSKKKQIDDAIEKSKFEQIKTGVWKNPEVDFNL